MTYVHLFDALEFNRQPIPQPPCDNAWQVLVQAFVTACWWLPLVASLGFGG